MSAYPKKDIDILTSQILLQSPIKHNVLSRNQPMKKEKKLLLLQKRRGWIQKNKIR